MFVLYVCSFDLSDKCLVIKYNNFGLLTVLERFLLFTTGGYYPQPNSIRVHFVDADWHGTITAHTLVPGQ